ncbi:glycosyltransferase [Longimicrobium terrae]|uniref:Glycosyltransferase involved in cell wall biosynthesis n=1 Tax=Longimicrobium terrae TaxID=1639882 RepID=A0A841H7K5_9BACT|nr:glycosyltransferase family 2 protein [Longimicrobium terrae]MBB4639552.1 glycosyltransferase involved in cell wall biosynthesis [Longimicrobium terrae]MBB6073923.1 glycosyltransferase involved in cell wall biosynthesis [Longimicrobium terrae]NNC30120.1 glycosyltransferase [Longimicrobium terrae]
MDMVIHDPPPGVPLWMWIIAILPWIVLAMAAFNVVAWPRGRRDGRMPGRVSVLIPARDEAERIEACVRGALANAPDEVIVYDDGSTDGTAAIVARLAEEDGRVRLMSGGPLPAGWVGKPHACHHLANAATGDVLVYMDADTVAEPECLARMGSLFDRMRADVVTAGTRQVTGTFAERLIIPLLHLTYLAWLPLPLVWRSRDPRFLVANGQLLAVRRAAYAAAGGWSAVRAEVVDDMAFCRRVKESGGRVVFADGHRMARCRMYRDGGEVVRGFSKNLYEGVGGRPVGLVGFALVHAAMFLLPYVAMVAGLVMVARAVPHVDHRGVHLVLTGALGVAANVMLRLLLAIRFRQPWESVLLHPFAVLGLIGIAINSARWSGRGEIRWRGRTYGARAARVAGSGSAAE